MRVQTKYMQTELCNKTGKLLYYRVTFPIPKKFVLDRNIKESQHTQCIKNRWFYVRKNIHHDVLEKYIEHLQSEVAKWKIEKLQSRVKNKQLSLF